MPTSKRLLISLLLAVVCQAAATATAGPAADATEANIAIVRRFYVDTAPATPTSSIATIDFGGVSKWRLPPASLKPTKSTG
jgi:hypothetical protein